MTIGKVLLGVALAALIAGALYFNTRRSSGIAQESARDAAARPSMASPTDSTLPSSPIVSPKPVPPSAGAALIPDLSARLRALQAVNTDDTATADRLTRELLAELTDSNVASVTQSLTSSEFDTSFGLGALRHWMRSDPLTAALWINNRSDKNENHVWIVAAELAQDPETLGAYLEHFPDNPWKQDVLYHAGRELASASPARALALAPQLSSVSQRTDLLETAVYAWAATDASAAHSWATSYPDLPMRHRLAAQAAKAVASRDPALGAHQLVASVTDRDVLLPNLLAIVDVGLAQGPAVTASWVARLPDGARQPALQAVANAWLISDRPAALNWLQSLSAPDFNAATQNGPAQPLGR